MPVATASHAAQADNTECLLSRHVSDDEPIADAETSYDPDQKIQERLTRRVSKNESVKTLNSFSSIMLWQHASKSSCAGAAAPLREELVAQERRWGVRRNGLQVQTNNWQLTQEPTRHPALSLSTLLHVQGVQRSTPDIYSSLEG